MLRTFSRRFRVGNTIGFLGLESENAAYSKHGPLKSLQTDGSIDGSLFPCVMTSLMTSQTQQRQFRNHRPVNQYNDKPTTFRTLCAEGYQLYEEHLNSNKLDVPLSSSGHSNIHAHCLYGHEPNIHHFKMYWLSVQHLSAQGSSAPQLNTNRLNAPQLGAHRYYSTNQGDKDSKEMRQTKLDEDLEEKKDDDKPKGVFQRFRDAYKEYGKALIGVHVITSAFWFGSFYVAAAKGLNVIPLLEYLGAGEKVIRTFQLPGVGNTAVAYLCYKIATPVRYTVTIVGTQLTVRQMRRWGYWEPVKPEDSIRSLMRESRENVKDRIDDVRDNVKDKIDDVRDNVKDRIDDVRDNVKDKIGDVKGNVKDKMGDVRGNVKGKIGDVKYDVKDKLTEMKGDFKDKYSDWKEKRG